MKRIVAEAASRGSVIWDSAEVCINGHVTVDSTMLMLDARRPFCRICGAATTSTCQECSGIIRGRTEMNIRSTEPMTAPSYCEHCGSAFPWTKSKIAAADELFDLIDYLTPEERQTLKDAFPDLIRDTPRSQAAALRTGKIMNKVGEGFGSVLKDLIVTTASESVRNILRSYGVPV